jgi:hypothetical protein
MEKPFPQAQREEHPATDTDIGEVNRRLYTPTAAATAAAGVGRPLLLSLTGNAETFPRKVVRRDYEDFELQGRTEERRGEEA